MSKKEEALQYHMQGQPGKIEVNPTKMLSTQSDLSLAYSPGVAEPCKAIAENQEDVYKYTSKGNLVAVISNGTAVLGLGDIGPEASKPVMEGKAVLFKKYAGIDSFDIEINEKDPDQFIKIVKALEPTFGGINLEDIKAPDCFKIETELLKQVNIPLMHDDQHGTAIISAAALINAAEIVGKKIENIKMVINGAGAAAIACAKTYMSLGMRKENIIMCDSKGVLRKSRADLDELKSAFAQDTPLATLQEAIVGCDAFVGLSKADVLTPKDILAMADSPIVFALANPDPEINYELAVKTRKDLILATGRSDHPNQVNNVLGFPYIFRGALDVRAKTINAEMQLAAIRALANLAKEPVPDVVRKAYDVKKIEFGKDYLIPRPMDPRLITTISPAVAKAAMQSGVARKAIADWNAYHYELQHRIGIDERFVAHIIEKAKANPKRIVFAEANHHKILKAAQALQDDGIAYPILLGNRKEIEKLIKEHKLELSKCQIISPHDEPEILERYAKSLYEKRQRRGATYRDCMRLLLDRNYFGAMMVELEEADALISGLTKDYRQTISPSLQIIGTRKGVKRVAGMYIMMSKKGNFIFSDCTVNIEPTAEELVEIIGLTQRGAKFFNIEPRMALLSYSNFGGSKGKLPEMLRETLAMAKEKYPNLVIDGEVQANIALNTNFMKENYPFSALAQEAANTLIFPNLAAANISYKLMIELGGAEPIGPIVLGMKKPVHILQLGSSIRDIVNISAIAVVDAQLQDLPDDYL